MVIHITKGQLSLKISVILFREILNTVYEIRKFNQPIHSHTAVVTSAIMCCDWITKTRNGMYVIFVLWCSVLAFDETLAGYLRYIISYSIRVPGWVLKCLNLITAPGSVSNQPGSVTWLATAGISKIHAVSWRNHIENQTTKGAQNM